MARRTIDFALAVRDGLRVLAPDAVIELGRDATYSPNELMTVVQSAGATPLGELPRAGRLALSDTVTLSTTGPNYEFVADEAEHLQAAILSLTDVNGVAFSSVSCDREPYELSPHEPSGATMMASVFTVVARRKEYA